MFKPKKVLIFALISLLAVAIVPIAVSAIEGPAECCVAHQAFTAPDGTTAIAKDAIIGKTGGYCPDGTPDYDEDDWSMACLLNITINVTNWVFYIMMIITVLFVIWGGIIFMTAGGDPDKAGKGKTLIVYALVGIVIGLLARIIPAIVRFVV